MQEDREVSNAAGRNRKNFPRVTITALQDEILLTIFDFCRVASVEWTAGYPLKNGWPKMWQNLVHVCQRWRYIVFSSPLRLNLRLRYTVKDRTSVREMLDVWPQIFIEIYSTFYLGDNGMAALEQHDRICDIHLRETDSDFDFERLATVMQKPFPALTKLCLSSHSNEHLSVFPDIFSRISAPRLRSLHLLNVPFPALPQLLLSCNDLSELKLQCIPYCHHFSPEAIVTCLSALPRLTYLYIQFTRSGTIGRPPPSTVTRALLPALTEFHFLFAVNEYVEDFMARIDLPRLSILTVIYEQHVLDIRQGISHSQTLGPFNRADVDFSAYFVRIRLYRTDPVQAVELGIDTNMLTRTPPGQQISSLAHICALSSSLLSSVTELDVEMSGLNWNDSHLEVLRHNPEWLVLFHPFSAVRSLHLSYQLQSFIISSLLGHTGESVTEVLPGLQNLYLYDQSRQDSVEEQAIEQFITARQNSYRPVTIQRMPEIDHDNMYSGPLVDNIHLTDA